MAEFPQKERLSESNKILIDLDQPATEDSSSMTSVPELVSSVQRIKAEKQELNLQKRDLQASEKVLRSKVIQEMDKRWKAIELLKSEILTLQNKCNEITPQILMDQALKKNTPIKTPIENMRQKRILLVSLIAAAGLIFYALGVASDFFGLPIFAPFFILSYNAAHEVAYGAIAAGAALSAVILTLNFRKNQKKF